MLLAIETATAACSVALFDGAECVAWRHEIVGRGHAERLIPMIAELPDGGRADAIRVNCGPGSFTGVRIGLAAARALGFAWDAEIGGYATMALIAAAHFRADAALAALIVATEGGHGEVFAQGYARDPFAATDALRSVRPADFGRADDRPIVGSGAQLLGAVPVFDYRPDARDAIMLPAALATLPPSAIYGRAPDAKLPA